jgi:hypothetical protein
VIVFVVGIFIFPISSYSFTIRYLSTMFLARTKDSELFLPTKLLKKNKKHKFKSFKVKTPLELKGTSIDHEVSNHRPIKIAFFKNLKMFMISQFSILSKLFSLSKHSRLLFKLIKKGKERIENDLSLEDIVKTLRDIKIVIKNNILDEELKFQIQHNHKNVIDLESEEGLVPVKVTMKQKRII